MMQEKKLMPGCALLLVLILCLTMSVAQAEDDDYSLLELDLEVSYDDVPWDFPIDLYDMNPAFIRLANKQMLLEKGYVTEPLVTLKTRKENSNGTTNGGVRKASSAEMQLQEDCAKALVQMCEDAEQQGIRLYLKSAYRSWQTQNTMYYNRLQKYGYDDGWVSMPGASDHQTALGCDVVSYEWRDRGMNEQFAETEEAQWMAAHCAEYGFILRYPENKVDVTEINYEPWHLRYVGNPVATYIMDNGLCLEEFHEQLAAAIEDFLAAGGRASLVEDFIWESAESAY